MYNFNPNFNYYNPNYIRYRTSYYPPASFYNTKMYNFKNYNDINKFKITQENDIKISNETTSGAGENNDNFSHDTNNTTTKQDDENIRFKFGDFTLTDKSINVLGLTFKFDDLILIILIILLFFQSDCDLSLIIVLGLMLLNINLSTIKNIF